MRAHPERSRDTLNHRKDLELSPRARFCTVIRQDGGVENNYQSLVVAIYPQSVSLGVLSIEAGRMVSRTNTPVVVEKLSPGQMYSAIWKKGQPAEVRTHGVDDGLKCRKP